MDENCGHCRWHHKEDEEWICENPDSDCWGCYTEYNETCNEYEERRPKNKFFVEVLDKRKK